MSTMIPVPETEVRYIHDALKTFEAELNELERAREWFVSDSGDRLASAIQITSELLGVQDNEHDEEESEIEQESFEFYEDGERISDYLDSLEYDE